MKTTLAQAIQFNLTAAQHGVSELSIYCQNPVLDAEAIAIGKLWKYTAEELRESSWKLINWNLLKQLITESNTLG